MCQHFDLINEALESNAAAPIRIKVKAIRPGPGPICVKIFKVH